MVGGTVGMRKGVASYCNLHKTEPISATPNFSPLLVVPRVVPGLSKERSMPGIVVPGSVAMAFVTASPRSVVLRYDGHSGQWQYCLGPGRRALCRRTGKVAAAAAAEALAVEGARRQLLAEMKMEKDLFPVGREVAGIVLDVGSKVSFFQPDDEVVGILPLDSEAPGLCEVTQVHEHYLVHKPEKVSWTEAAGAIRDGVRACTALYYLSHLSPGKSVLIMDGASAFGTIAIQLAHHRGAKVISTACSLEDKQHLERIRPSIARVIDVSNGKVHVAESCLEETGGLGVDIVIDAGVRLYSKDDEPAVKLQLPHKHDIITLLGVGGHWVTTEENLQLDPPDSHCLFLKGATVAFLNDEVWNLSNAQQGKYLCILKDVMDKLSAGIFRPLLDEPIPLYEAKASMEIVQKNQERKKQVVQF